MTYTTTTKKKAVKAINFNGLHTDTNGASFPTASAQCEERFTQIAVIALAGHTAHQFDGCGLIVCSWSLVRYLPTLDDARRLLAQIGGSHGV